MSSASLVRHAFSRQSLLALVALVGLVMSVLISGGSTAAFTAASTNDNSTLSTVNFSLTNNQASALFSITDAVPGDWVQKNVTLTTVGTASLTLTLANGTTGGVVAPLNR